MIGKCKKCDNTSFYTERNGNHTGLYCEKCGAWIKWLSKDELRVVAHNKKTEQTKNNFSYFPLRGSLRGRLHFILEDFFNHEIKMYNSGEYDWEYLEYSTDEILRVIKQQGGSVGGNNENL